MEIFIIACLASAQRSCFRFNNLHFKSNFVDSKILIHFLRSYNSTSNHSPSLLVSIFSCYSVFCSN